MTEDRYSRLAQIEWWDRDRLRSAHAVVVGAGALGNEVIKNLLLLGWGTITVVDFDTIEASNLSRSVLYRAEDVGLTKVEAAVRGAHRLNPDCRVIGVADDLRTGLSAGMVRRADVVLGCLDNMAARVVLSQLAAQAGVLLIDGGLTTWEGTVRLFLPPDGPCYVCGLTDADLSDLTLRHSCLAYRRRAEASLGVPTTPTVASTVGAMMVQQAIRWISRDHHTMAVPVGSELRFDLAHDRLWRLDMPVNERCLLHPEPVTPRETELDEQHRWSDIVDFWRGELGGDPVLHLPLYVLRSWTCPTCSARAEVHRVHPGDRQVFCGQCGSEVALDLVDQIDGTQPWHRLSPSQTGFPRWSWIEVHAGSHVVVFELAESAPGGGRASDIDARVGG